MLRNSIALIGACLFIVGALGIQAGGQETRNDHVCGTPEYVIHYTRMIMTIIHVLFGVLLLVGTAVLIIWLVRRHRPFPR